MPASKSPREAREEDGKGSGDCLGCRITGGLFGIFGSAFIASALLQNPSPRGPHRAGIIAAAGTMFLFGFYRAAGPSYESLRVCNME